MMKKKRMKKKTTTTKKKKKKKKMMMMMMMMMARARGHGQDEWGELSGRCPEPDWDHEIQLVP